MSRSSLIECRSNIIRRPKLAKVPNKDIRRAFQSSRAIAVTITNSCRATPVLSRIRCVLTSRSRPPCFFADAPREGEYAFDFAVVICGVRGGIHLPHSTTHLVPAIVLIRKTTLSSSDLRLSEYPAICTVAFPSIYTLFYPRKLKTKKCSTIDPNAKSAKALRPG